MGSSAGPRDGEPAGGLSPRVVALATREDARELIAEVAPCPAGLDILSEKAYTRAVKLQRVELRAAILIKQEMIAAGGDAAVSRDVADLTARVSDVVLLAPRVWRCGGVDPRLGARTLVMGILNVTPDSFSDGGAYLSCSDAVERARELTSRGVDVIDVGGESTRPGAAAVTEEQEAARVLPVVEAILHELGAVVSVDTSKAGVAKRALDLGAHVVNDVTAFSDPLMGGVVHDHGAGATLMHMQGEPRTMQLAPAYECLISDILGFLRSIPSWWGRRAVRRGRRGRCEGARREADGARRKNG